MGNDNTYNVVIGALNYLRKASESIMYPGESWTNICELPRTQNIKAKVTAGQATRHRDSCTDKMAGSIADRPDVDYIGDLFHFMMSQITPGGKNNGRWLAGACMHAMSHHAVARNQDVRAVDLSSLALTRLQEGKPHPMHAITWTLREGKIVSKTGKPEHTGGGRHRNPKTDMFTHLLSLLFYQFNIAGKGPSFFTTKTFSTCCSSQIMIIS